MAADKSRFLILGQFLYLTQKTTDMLEIDPISEECHGYIQDQRNDHCQLRTENEAEKAGHKYGYDRHGIHFPIGKPDGSQEKGAPIPSEKTVFLPHLLELFSITEGTGPDQKFLVRKPCLAGLQAL